VSDRCRRAFWPVTRLRHNMLMPIPADSVGSNDVTSTILALFGQVHDQIRREIEGLDVSGLNWIPGLGANSVATIITHIVGSEAETLRTVAGLVGVRDRDAEFGHPSQSSAQVSDSLDRADRLITEIGPQITSGRLRARMSLPTLPPDERRPGLTWLVGNYGHTREHVGQIQLTKQLYTSA